MVNKTKDRKVQAKIIDENFEKKISKYNISAKKIMPIVVISVIVDILGYMLVVPLLPFYAQSFGASEFMIGVVVALNAVTSLISGPIWGKLSDKHGRKPILLLSQLGTLISFGLLAISNSIEMLMFSRILDGLFGGQIPVINAAITDVSAPETRSEKLAVLAVSITVGTIIGPIIGGFLGEINLTYPAYAACVMAVVTIIATLLIFNETMPKQRRNDLKEWRKTDESFVNKSCFTRRVMLRLTQTFAIIMILSLVYPSLSLILNQMYSVTSSSIGIVLAAGGLCTFFFGAILLKPIKYRIGEQRMLVLGIAFLILSYLILPILPTFTSFFLFMIVFTAGENFARPVVTSNLSKAVDADKQGTISGYSMAMDSLARTIAPLITTGWLDLGGLTICALELNEFQLIGLTGVFTGFLFLCLYLIDQKQPAQ